MPSALRSPEEGSPLHELAQLRNRVDAISGVDAGMDLPRDAYLRIAGGIYQLCSAISACERAGFSRESIRDVIEPVRRICARSPFVRRLQTWPRGYPGDFETIEHLCRGDSGAEPDSVADALERFSLTRAIAQQHRNKVQQQAAHVMRALVAHQHRARILSFACGSCPDLRSLESALPALAGEVWLNDADPEALAFSARALARLEDRLHVREGNVVRVSSRLAIEQPGTFDVVLAGGLFDYLSERTVTCVIERAVALLRPGGTFFFTNLAEGNPYRTLIEYLGDWFLIERTEADVLRFCRAAAVPPSAVSIRRDTTGLALLVEIVR